MAELDAPPPSEATREGLTAGRFRALEEEIVKLIYGTDKPQESGAMGQLMLGGNDGG